MQAPLQSQNETQPRKQIKFKILRFDPNADSTPHYDFFEIEAGPNERILDCLNRIRWTRDSSLAFRMSCGHGVCGSDGVTINGIAALACQKRVIDYADTAEIVIEPLKFFRIIKDLVVDMQPFFDRIGAVQPRKIQILPTDAEKEHTQTAEDRALIDDAVKCILCACCVAACPVMLSEDPAFIGPAAILRAQRYIFDSRVADLGKRLQVLEKPHGIWSCKSYYRCTLVCPKKIKVTQAILKTKKKIQEEQTQKTGGG